MGDRKRTEELEEYREVQGAVQRSRAVNKCFHVGRAEHLCVRH